MITYPLNIGCTIARHRRLGVHATINARAGLQHLNSPTDEEIEQKRDGRAIKNRIAFRIAVHQVCSKFFRRHRHRIAHLISDDRDNY